MCTVNIKYLCPSLTILVVYKYAFLGLDIIFNIEECHEPILYDKFVVKSLKAFLLSDLKELIAHDEINKLLDLRLLVVIL